MCKLPTGQLDAMRTTSAKATCVAFSMALVSEAPGRVGSRPGKLFPSGPAKPVPSAATPTRPRRAGTGGRGTGSGTEPHNLSSAASQTCAPSAVSQASAPAFSVVNQTRFAVSETFAAGVVAPGGLRPSAVSQTCSCGGAAGAADLQPCRRCCPDFRLSARLALLLLALSPPTFGCQPEFRLEPVRSERKKVVRRRGGREGGNKGGGSWNF